MANAPSPMQAEVLRKLAQRQRHPGELHKAWLAQCVRSGWAIVGAGKNGLATITMAGREAIGAAPKQKVRVPCPDCGYEMRVRTGPYGQFYGCQNYPACTGKISIPNAAHDADNVVPIR